MKVFTRQIVFREPQGVFVERDQEAIVGHYTRRGTIPSMSFS